MSRLPARILAQCLDAVESGEATLEECISRYPQYDEELIPLLRMAATLRRDPSMGPRPSFRRTARRRLLTRLPEQAPARGGIAVWPVWQSLPRRAATAWMVVIASLAVLLCSSGIVFAAERTLPGDALYPVKTTVEEARLWIAQGDRDASLSLQFAETRIQEIRYLGTAGRFGDLPAAAGRFEDQMQRTDRALRELAERDAALAEALTARSQETRTTYRHELAGLLQAAPDAERTTIEGLLHLVDDLHPEDLLDEDSEREAHPPAAVDDSVPGADDDSAHDDDQPLLQERPEEKHDDDDSEDRDSPQNADDVPEQDKAGSDAETGETDDAEGHDAADRPDGSHDPEAGVPAQDDETSEEEGRDNTPDHDDSDPRAPSTGDESGETDGSGDDGSSDEHHDSGDADGSGEHGDTGEHDAADEHDSSDSGYEHDGEHD